MKDERHQLLTAALDAYAREYPTCTSAPVVRRFVTEDPRWWDRENTRGHVTASAWVIDPDDRSILLVHHRKLDRWLQPGGHLEDEQSIHAAAEREAREETGLTDLRWRTTNIFDLDIHTIPERQGFPAHQHFDVRSLFEGSRLAPIQRSAASEAVAPWSPEEL